MGIFREMNSAVIKIVDPQNVSSFLGLETARHINLHWYVANLDYQT